MLTAASVAVASGDLCLVVVCWKRRSVLGGVLAAVGVSLVLLAIGAGPARVRGEQALAVAAILLVIGTALYGLLGRSSLL